MHKSFGPVFLCLLGMVAFATMARADDCPELAPFTGHPENDASAAIQACLNRTGTGTLTLPAGTFGLANQVKVAGSLTLSGTSADGAPCTPSAANCTTLQAIPTAAFSQAPPGIVHFTGSVKVKHMIFDGNRSARMNSPSAAVCAGGNNAAGFTASGDSLDGATFDDDVFENALCGSGFAPSSLKNSTIINTWFYGNGINSVQSMWSDGLTVGNGSGSTISNNQFIDNTDVQLIFGGCQNCTVENNGISHGADKAHSSYVGLHLQAWPGGSGDYTGSVFRNNQINCNFHCGFGISVGADPWYPGINTFGGQVTGNTVAGALVGINLASPSAAVAMDTNKINFYPDGVMHCLGDPNKAMPNAAVNFTAQAQRVMDAASTADLAGVVSQLGPNSLTLNEFTGCIPDMQKSQPGVAINNNGSTIGDGAPAKYVPILYRKLLSREPDSGGLLNWVKQANATCPAVAAGIAQSPEFLDPLAPLSNADFVTALYQKLLKRAPDAGGDANWLGALNGGLTRAQVAADIAQSDEFAASCANP